jgi:hypothetical protein
MSAARTTGGAIALGIGGLMALGGGALVAVDSTQRNDDGYYELSSRHLASGGHAVASENLDLGGIGDLGDELSGSLRIRINPDGTAPVFVGIAPRKDVDAYLAGVGYSEVTDLDDDSIEFDQHAGGAPAGNPADQTFWKATSTGAGARTLNWKTRDGDWRVVVMNADAASGVNADMTVGAKTDLLMWIGWPLLGLGLLVAGGGAVLLTVRSRNTGEPTGEPTDVTSAA